MRYLLDTHIFLWMQSAPERIGEQARAIVAAPDNELLLSAASAWEIAIKHGIGRLQLPEQPDRYVPDRMRRSGVDGLPIAHAHALHVARLPPLHRDPFDRMLVAQANIESLPLMTVDEALMEYEVTTIDART